MQPRIEILQEIKLVGKKARMSFTANKTKELWQSFMPRRSEIRNAVDAELYSVEVYKNTTFSKNFDPANEFEKWAAVKVPYFDTIPDGMNTLIIPQGQYAVFPYKGKPSEAQATYQYIHGVWLPNSEYDLDDRPHFALMGEKYRGEHPGSEEELWIPVKKR
jgi:AraC family transcriptional regulator